MKDFNNLDDLKAEFDKFVHESCIGEEQKQQAEEEADLDEAPAFVDEISEKLLGPAHAGVYLSRLDIKRVAEAIDESLPIKERKRMIKSLMRHTTTKDYLRGAFGEFSKHINGRLAIYQELGDAFPSSKYIFDEFSVKAERTKKMFNRIIEDFEEFNPKEDLEPVLF
ncbi:hypothetical protein JHD50_03295 [Sulfurimonas sp. MAG313]|nr:hypothetical protein [Sulfurimonas sp. MAG313]MDF1880338.1 hypothetical protein [Sulfurimonas sp. MAG313]